MLDQVGGGTSGALSESIQNRNAMVKKHRLLFLSNLFPSVDEPVRGLDNATLLNTLSKWWEIRVISPRPFFLNHKKGGYDARGEDLRLEPCFIPTRYLPKIGGRINHRWMSRTLIEPFTVAMKEFQPDIVLSSWLFPDGFCAAQLCAEKKVPLVLVTQGTDTHGYLQIPYRRERILWAIERAEAAICRSKDLALLLHSAGAPLEKLQTIYNGVDTECFKLRDQRSIRRELGLDCNEDILLFVGNYLPVKNPNFLINSFGSLNQKRVGANLDPARLIMIGDGPLKHSMHSVAQTSDCPDLVEIHGRKSPDEIARYMNAANAFCLSSRNEGFPNVILEAFASGLPVISTNVGGISELLTPSRGVLVEQNDSVAYVEAIEQTLKTLPRPKEKGKSAFDPGWVRAASEYDRLLKKSAHQFYC